MRKHVIATIFLAVSIVLAIAGHYTWGESAYDRIEYAYTDNDLNGFDDSTGLARESYTYKFVDIVDR